MTTNLISSRSANIVNSRAGPNADIDAELGELTQSTPNRPFLKPLRTRFRRYITPWATNLSPKISYEHRRRVGRLTLDLNQDTFGKYPSIDDFTHPKPCLLNPSPGREVLQQTEDQKSENLRTGRDGDDLGWPTEAVDLQIPADKPKRADSGDQFKSGLSSPHGGWITAKLGLPNSVKLESKLRFDTLASSAITLNQPPETEKGRSETAQHETKLQRQERKEQEARAAKAEKIRLKNLRECAVCMETFDKGQLIHPCHHYYCSECLAGMPSAFFASAVPDYYQFAHSILNLQISNFEPLSRGTHQLRSIPKRLLPHIQIPIQMLQTRHSHSPGHPSPACPLCRIIHPLRTRTINEEPLILLKHRLQLLHTTFLHPRRLGHLPYLLWPNMPILSSNKARRQCMQTGRRVGKSAQTSPQKRVATMSRLRAFDLQRSRVPAHDMFEVLYSVLLHVWHGTSVYMPFVSFLTVYSSGEGWGRKGICIYLPARLFKWLC